MANFQGRKMALIEVTILQICASILSTFANAVICLYIARFVSGLAFGAYCVLIPMYIPEIAEKSVRGKTTVFFWYDSLTESWILTLRILNTRLEFPIRIFVISINITTFSRKLRIFLRITGHHWNTIRLFASTFWFVFDHFSWRHCNDVRVPVQSAFGARISGLSDVEEPHSRCEKMSDEIKRDGLWRSWGNETNEGSTGGCCETETLLRSYHTKGQLERTHILLPFIGKFVADYIKISSNT